MMFIHIYTVYIYTETGVSEKENDEVFIGNNGVFTSHRCTVAP